ncbi:MAG: 4-hydroxy-tetrahydrodipicolinate synthase [Chlamydiae bacterium RIFCSPHIGHO2_12_FULL_27_8]|nr:MAG: 4-hydroxy-tetrahydrodipicolinate synthase [Chlamydiae bacterium RIFCSPHIGHO2_12_FULL_27_8]
MKFEGSYTALVTPFNEKDEIDEKTLIDLINFQIEANTDALVLSGTTGESPTLSEKEKLFLFKTAVKESKNKIKIIAGTGTNNTKNSVELSKKAKDVGVCGLLIVIPYYNRPSEIGILKHFEEISKVGLPIILYHHPKRTGTKLSFNFFKMLKNIENVKAIKEASSDLNYMKEIKGYTNLPIFSGDDPLIVDIFKSGGVGSISVISNIIPKVWKKITDLCLNKQFDKAQIILNEYLPLIESIFLESNPICTKYALSLMNKCNLRLRLPLIEPSENSKEIIKKEILKKALLSEELLI